jgi:hypothetical protein
MIRSICVAACLAGFSSVNAAGDDAEAPESLVIRSPFPVISSWDVYYDDPIGSALPRSEMSASSASVFIETRFRSGRYTISFADTQGCQNQCLYEEADWQLSQFSSPYFTIRISSFRPTPEIVLDPAIVVLLDEQIAGEAGAFLLIVGNAGEYRLMRWIDEDALTFETVQPVCTPETGAEIVAGQNRRLLGPWDFRSHCQVTTREQLEAVIRASLDAQTPGDGDFIWQYQPE